MSVTGRLLDMIEKTSLPYMMSTTPLPRPNRHEVNRLCEAAFDEYVAFNVRSTKCT